MPTVTLYPAVSGDDFMWYTGGSSLNTAGVIMAVGRYGTSGDRSGIRFPSVSIPQGSTITSAILTFYSYGSTSGTTCNVKIYGNNVDNAVAPTTHAQAQGLALTTASVSWSGIGSWTAGNGYNAPDLKTIIQEIINRAGWSSGNAIQIIVHDDASSTNAYRTPHTWDGGSSSYYAKLVITYSQDTIVNVPAFSGQSAISIVDVYRGQYAESAPFTAQGSLNIDGLQIGLFVDAFASLSSLIAGLQQQVPCPSFTCVAALQIFDIYYGYMIESQPLHGQTSLAGTPLISIPGVLSSIANLSVTGFQIQLPSIFISAGHLEANATSFIDRDFVVSYLCVLSAPGFPDIILPVSSFQARFRSGEPSFLSAVVPGMDHAGDIADRADGTIKVYMVKTYRDGNRIAECIGLADLDDIRIDEGTLNQSITLSGYRTETHEPKTIILTGASYRMMYQGQRRYRCQPNIYLRPGDTVIAGGETFQADVVTWAIGPGTEIMEVAEE